MRQTRSHLVRRIGWVATGLVLLSIAGQPARTSEPDPRMRSFRGPVSGSTYAFEEEPHGAKTLRGPDGRTYGSAREVDEAERGLLSPLQQVLDGDLAALAEDVGRGDERVLVTILFENQPIQPAGLAARERHGEELRSLERRRAQILDRIAPLRAERTDGEPPTLQEAVEEEARLLTKEEKDELIANRDRVLAILADLRREVLAEATPAVDEDQARVRSYVESLPGAVYHSRSVVLSTLTAEVPASALRPLATEFDEISRIRRTGRATPTLDSSTGTVGAGTWWSAGYNGSTSTKVAVMDTGIDSSHPALSGMVSNASVFHTTASTDSWYNDSTTNTDDFYGHGTEVAGVVGSTDSTYRGVAYGGRLMNAKAGFLMVDGSAAAYDSDMMSAGDWAANNGAYVLNYSYGQWSSTTDGSSNIALYFDGMAYYLSIPVAISAGNDGTSTYTIGVPADAFNVFAAGGVDDRGTSGTSDDRIYTYSSAGPCSDGRLKPDLVAPGQNVTTCTHAWEGSSADFVTVSGTSFAAPHLAGAVALLMDYGAATYNEGYRALLIGTSRTASPYDSAPGNLWGWGGLHLGNAYTCRGSVHEASHSSSGSRSVFLTTGALSAGDRVTLAWNRQVTSNGSAAPTSYQSLMDMDLYVYDGATGADLGYSISSVDSFEQVAISSATSMAVVEVYRYGSFPSGITSEYWGVATESTGSTNSASAPDLSCSFDALPNLVGASAEFTVTVRVDNPGGLPALDPDLTLTLPSGYTLISGTSSVTLPTIAADDYETVSWTVRAPSGPSGLNTFRASSTSDSFGLDIESAEVSATQGLDVDPPMGTVLADDGMNYTTSTLVWLTLNAWDSVSTVPLMRLRESTGTWGEWVDYTPQMPFTLTEVEGTHTIEVQYQDALGNASASFTDSIVYDVTPPTGSVAIESGAQYTGSSDVRLALTASDASSFVTDLSVSDDGTAWGSWQQYLGFASHTLPAGDGERTVYVRFRDAAGNVSQAFSDSIVVDETAPAGSALVAAGKEFVNSSTVNVVLSANDSSGITAMRFGEGGATWEIWQPFVASATRTLPPGEGPRSVFVQFLDGAGNVSAVVQDSVIVDLTRPAGTFKLSGDAAYVLPWQTTVVDPQVSDPGGSGVADFRYSTDGGVSWSAWKALAGGPPEVTFPPGSDDRLVTVTCEFRDAAGNVSQSVSDGIHVIAAQPQQAQRQGALAGSFPAGGDVDAYRLDLLSGETLDVGLAAKPQVKSKLYAVTAEVWGPDGRLVVLPPGSKKKPVRKFVAPTSGTYWLVLRATGADAKEAASYKLKFKTRTPKSLVKLRGTAIHVEGEPDGTVSLEFTAGTGFQLTATLTGEPAPAATLVAPGGSRTEFTLPGSRRGKVTLTFDPLPDGIGTFRLTLGSAQPVPYTLSLTPPKSQKAIETP